MRLLALVKSRRGHVTSEQGTRSGHDIVYRIGNLMSGQPSCAPPPPPLKSEMYNELDRDKNLTFSQPLYLGAYICILALCLSV